VDHSREVEHFADGGGDPLHRRVIEARKGSFEKASVVDCPELAQLRQFEG
jgi:hypothetical protein